jgi:hypothetical protein
MRIRIPNTVFYLAGDTDDQEMLLFFNTHVGEIRSMDLLPDSTVLGRRYLLTGDKVV